jgi:hypothetical protein
MLSEANFDESENWLRPMKSDRIGGEWQKEEHFPDRRLSETSPLLRHFLKQ